MTEKQTGGPAFPMSDPFVVKCPKDVAEAQRLAEGMTLRDYFAAKAMVGILNQSDQFWDGAAPLAYRYADDMLKAREA